MKSPPPTFECTCYPFLAHGSLGLSLSDDCYNHEPINIILKKKIFIIHLLQEGYTVLNLCLAMIKGIHIQTQTDERDL
jgi:hypothetical protein